jgi:hypothetical protein
VAWAFGCVLYEMLTGKRIFDGEEVSDTLAAVLRGDPEWTALPSAVPPGVAAMLRRCREKDPTAPPRYRRRGDPDRGTREHSDGAASGRSAGDLDRTLGAYRCAKGGGACAGRITSLRSTFGANASYRLTRGMGSAAQRQHRTACFVNDVVRCRMLAIRLRFPPAQRGALANLFVTDPQLFRDRGQCRVSCPQFESSDECRRQEMQVDPPYASAVQLAVADEGNDISVRNTFVATNRAV